MHAWGLARRHADGSLTPSLICGFVRSRSASRPCTTASTSWTPTGSRWPPPPHSPCRPGPPCPTSTSPPRGEQEETLALTPPPSSYLTHIYTLTHTHPPSPRSSSDLRQSLQLPLGVGGDTQHTGLLSSLVTAPEPAKLAKPAAQRKVLLRPPVVFFFPFARAVTIFYFIFKLPPPTSVSSYLRTGWHQQGRLQVPL